jgi:hypothetical protein
MNADLHWVGLYWAGGTQSPTQAIYEVVANGSETAEVAMAALREKVLAARPELATATLTISADGCYLHSGDAEHGTLELVGRVAKMDEYTAIRHGELDENARGRGVFGREIWQGE